MKLTPVSVVCPVLSATTVYCTTEPGVVLALFAVTATFSPGTSTGTVDEHRGSVPPDGQLLPAAAEVTVLTRLWFPVSGLATVTE